LVDGKSFNEAVFRIIALQTEKKRENDLRKRKVFFIEPGKILNHPIKKQRGKILQIDEFILQDHKSNKKKKMSGQISGFSGEENENVFGKVLQLANYMNRS